jgi:L-ascorbate metabolism protein UlaG (beta-lactamase superfamily)
MLVVFLWLVVAPALRAQTVKITPLGSHTGELCANDRALLFEDPTGVRILYDVGAGVAGAGDPRLGEIDVVLLSHAHGDHIGATKAAGINAGTCAIPATVSAAPNSNTAEIAAGRNAAVITSNNMAAFLAQKIKAITGVRPEDCPAAGLAREMSVPRSAPCIGNLQLGGKRMVKRLGQASGVQVALVRADHSNNVDPGLLSGASKDESDQGISAYVGQANGYVVVFTNGLRAYLSGDTAPFGDMKTIFAEFYRVNLAVLNIGAFAMQGEEAAFVTDQLVKPASVIPSHVNEAATGNGTVLPGTKTHQFMDLVKSSQVHVPLSGRTMEFNGQGRCVSGC